MYVTCNACVGLHAELRAQCPLALSAQQWVLRPCRPSTQFAVNQRNGAYFHVTFDFASPLATLGASNTRWNLCSLHDLVHAQMQSACEAHPVPSAAPCLLTPPDVLCRCLQHWMLTLHAVLPAFTREAAAANHGHNSQSQTAAKAYVTAEAESINSANTVVSG